MIKIEKPKIRYINEEIEISSVEAIFESESS